MRVKLADGSDLSVKGIVDRVDVFEKDGEQYLRVVDYKTYDKTLSREDLQKGLDTQMLLYLYSLCENQSPETEQKLGLDRGKTAKPAGILYLNVGKSGIPQDVADAPDGGGKKYFPASGLLLADAEDLTLPTAMEEQLEGRYIPIKLNRNGKLSRGSFKSMATEEEFQQIKADVVSALQNCGEGIRGGVAHAHPLSDAKHDGCEFCKMRPICRRRKE